MTSTRVQVQHPRLFVYLVAAIIMSGYDAVATMHHIGRGVAAEGNPLMESLIEQHALLFFFVKMALTAFCLFVCYNYSHLKTARLGIKLAFGIYIMVSAYHTAIVLLA
jgi:hypothetical protein